MTTKPAMPPGQIPPGSAKGVAASRAAVQSNRAAGPTSGSASEQATIQIGSLPGAIAAPNPGDERMRSAALAMLQLQAELRKARTSVELGYCIANEARQLLRAQQLIVVERAPAGRYVVRAVSSLSSIDRSSPLILWFEGVVELLEKEYGLTQLREFDADAFSGKLDFGQAAYPLSNLMWVPWQTAGGEIVGGMVLARSTPWTTPDGKIASHLAGAFAHAWRALQRPSALNVLSKYMTRRSLAIAAVAGAIVLAFPISMSALAPVEVAPRNSAIVTSGVEGVVKAVVVDPNSPVKAGQVLLTLVDTVMKNRLELAEREVLVAETKFKKAGQLAFTDVRGRHELGVAKAELDLKIAERDYARDLFQRLEIKAERDGIAFFADKKDLVGRPIAVGEKLMEIAATDAAEFHIDLSVADAIVLHDGARVKVFLDSDPLNPIEAKVVRAGYKATMRETQQLAFRLVAEVAGGQVKPLRLGVRGTAQVYSDTVPFGYYLFRRPIAVARQWIGL